ncbi:hypothetical protein SERLA73DRAFT_175448 [Serpula lacrymans var. lacrymans S7.3]|uniref:glutathione transferase n=2 Tax=Serpula lacrymans var. lacrymans TaxID=341189 RepID=F8PJX5_SERL3|nr:uncharacterized protein SERLADRAFT_457720 [Serpula lacrymans var. lacrymans S7.9]EGO03797.1 hypothetical protein SERLA73DRAFT_175448 [Serpula lacrymans var. lacrymans S7.3]EGO29659.1 hypothetical protein SERLADRAFT_457720 [Serpula lacrymans var. lacrymans S7.9]
MTLKIYGIPLSTCVRRVAVVCKEKNVPYEVVPVDLSKAEHKSASYLEKQPFGQVPYIDDDGFVLYESRAIGTYITRKYASQGTQDLIPTSNDPEVLAIYERGLSIETSQFDPSTSGLAWENVFKKMYGVETDKARVEELLTTLNGKLDGYERILSKQKYIAGDHVTLADLFHLPYGSMLGYQGNDILESETRPNVARWWKDISSRPSWEAVKNGA